jgi:tetratricopeptide (TPR) repeat protein
VDRHEDKFRVTPVLGFRLADIIIIINQLARRIWKSMLKPALKRAIPLALTVMCLSVGMVGATTRDAHVDEMTQKAAAFCKEGKFLESTELTRKAIALSPTAWYPRAALSYFNWQQGNVLGAIEEGKRAVAFAPKNKLAIANLAHMQESLNDCIDAIPLYEKCQVLSPEEVEPLLGAVRCRFKMGKETEALASLKRMSAQRGHGYEWNFRLTQTCLEADHPEVAVRAASDAVATAANADQRHDAKAALLTVLLRTGDKERALGVAQQLFGASDRASAGRYKGGAEIYVRAAGTLLGWHDFLLARKILESAVGNLNDSEDSDGFFRLARVFEARGQADIGGRGDWLTLATRAYRRAIELDPTQSRSHLSLAGALYDLGHTTEAKDELAQAGKLEQFDPLPNFFMDHLTGDDLNLTKATFKVEKLSCNCHASRIIQSLSKVDGVAFADIPAKKFDQCTLVFDPNVTSPTAAFAKAMETFAPKDASTKAPDVKFAVLSTESISRPSQVIALAQATRCGEPMQFFSQFAAVEPISPVVKASGLSPAGTMAEKRSAHSPAPNKASAKRPNLAAVYK